MWFTPWLQTRPAAPRGRRPRRPAAPRSRPALEALGDRLVPSTLIVTNPLDDGSAGSLRAEIAAAAGGDTIVFDPALDGQTVVLGGSELLIDKDLDIEGPGAGALAVSGNGVSRVFEVAPTAHVTLAGLTIENGYAFPPDVNHSEGGTGAGIRNAGTLTVAGCTLSANHAYLAGGGVYNAGTLIIDHTALSSNNAGAFGGGNGGGVYNAGTLAISASTLSGNGCAGPGGGIFNGSGATLTVSGCTLSGNSSLSSGGGIYNLGTATVTQSTITGNGAGYSPWSLSGEGGGIYNAGTLTLSGSSVTNNTAEGTTGEGGGIFNASGATLTILNSVVRYNHAKLGADVYDVDSAGTGGGTGGGTDGKGGHGHGHSLLRPLRATRPSPGRPAAGR
jgi:hypothetical protein